LSADAADPSRRRFLAVTAASGLGLASTRLTTTAPRARRSATSPMSGRSFRSPETADLEVGPGAWCWFQSPRAVIDGRDRLWLGSTVGGTGTARDGDVQVDAVDLRTMSPAEHHVVGRNRVDDHASPSVSIVEGELQVAWSSHDHDPWIRIGGLDRPLATVSIPGSVVPPGRGVGYASAHVVGGERWMLYRGEGFTWNLLTSADGVAWQPRGSVVVPAPAPSRPGVDQRPYLLAASDGRRLHVVVSDGNPTEFPGTSVGCAVIEADLTVRDASGRRIGHVGEHAPTVARLTRLFTGLPGTEELSDVDGWVTDLQVVHRRPTAIITVREPWPAGATAPLGTQRHRHLWARQRHDGRWTVEHLAWGGSELYVHQPDYSGLAAVDPSNPRRVVVSTDVQPSTGAPLRSRADGRVHWELWEGYRHTEGTWSWAALTTDSTLDNIRPVIAAADSRKALAWMRGTYRTWMQFRTDVVVRRA
jgi:hypothetical protein